MSRRRIAPRGVGFDPQQGGGPASGRDPTHRLDFAAPFTNHPALGYRWVEFRWELQ